MTHQQHIIRRLNNKAAAAIDAQQYKSAVVGLVQALNLSDRESPSTTTSACDCSAAVDLDACLSFSQKALLSSSSSTAKGPINPQPQHYVFQEPLRFPPMTSADDLLDSDVVHLIVVFNLALATHIRAMSEQPKRQKAAKSMLLSSALKLYDLAAWILSRSVISPAASADEDDQTDARAVGFAITRLSMVLCNNMGDIHRQLGNTLQYRACLEELQSTAMMVRLNVEQQQEQQQEPTSSGESQDEDNKSRLVLLDLNGFLQNTAPLVLNDCCAGQA